MTRRICVHAVQDFPSQPLPGISVAARTTTLQELQTALDAVKASAVVVDLDEETTFGVVCAIRENLPDIAVIGVTGKAEIQHVIAAQRAGCAQIVTRPIDLSDLITALHQALEVQAPPHGKVITVMGTIGGAGATTIACHLAVEMAAMSKQRVGLVDLDFEFGGVARAFDTTPSFTIADLANMADPDETALSSATTELPGGVCVVSRPNTIQQAHEIDESAVRHILETASRAYPLLLLDTPRRFDPTVGAAIELCDKLLIVLQLTVPSVDNARRVVDALREEGVVEEKFEFVVNRYRKNVHSCTVEMIEEQLRRKVLAVIPSDYQAVRGAIDTGRPMNGDSPVRRAIRELAECLEGAPKPATPHKGWLSKLGLAKQR